MSPAVMMVVAGKPGLLQLLSGGKSAPLGRALEGRGNLRQLIGLRCIPIVAGSGGGLLQLACDLRKDGLELLRALCLQLLQLSEKLRHGGNAEHINWLLDRGG